MQRTLAHIQDGVGAEIIMRHHLGVLLQTAALALLPLVIVWEISFQMHLIFVPAMLFVGIVVFGIGTKLRG